MFINILSAIAILEIMFGTILSILCVLGMKIKDIWKLDTLAGIGKNGENALTQQLYARCGITYIIIGSLLQIYLIFMDNISCMWFLALTIIVLIVPAIVSAIFKKKYDYEVEKRKKRK